MKIDKVLAGYAKVGAELGKDTFDVEQFRKDLDVVRAESARIYWIWVGAVVVLFLLALTIFAVWVRTPLEAAGVLAAAGLSIPALLRQLQVAWEQKVQADTLLAFAGTLDRSVMLAMVRAFLRRFAEPPPRAAKNVKDGTL